MMTVVTLTMLVGFTKVVLGLPQKVRAFTDHLAELHFGAQPEDPRPPKDRRQLVSLYMTPEEAGVLHTHRVFLRGRNGAAFLQSMGEVRRCEACHGLSLK